MNTNEEKLIAGCLKHQPESQRALYETYKVSMYRVCLRYACNSEEAQDFLQEGFIKVFNDLSKFRGDGALGGWIRRIMVNTALQYIRKRKLFFSELNDEVHGLQYHTEASIDNKLNTEGLTQLIQQLPDGYRVVFNMFVVEGYSHQEIAEQLGISPGTSKSQLSKAKAHLRKTLENIMLREKRRSC